MLQDVFLVGGVRTPIGSLSGSLAPMNAVELGAAAVEASMQRSGVGADQVHEVIFGNVLGAGQGQNVARQVSIRSGIPPSVGGTTINKVCGSGLKSVMLAAQAIQCGDAHVVVAGGTESMTNAPYLLPKARAGYRMGHGELVDSMIHDGLWDIYNNKHMGMCGDDCAASYGFTREDQDAFAIQSYRLALAAADQGAFADEIVPVEIKGRKGEIIVVDSDEEPRRFDEKKLRGLRPAFAKEGTVTAGNASSINDGAAAVIAMSGRALDAAGARPMARVIGYGGFAREPEWFTLAPLGAVDALHKQLGLTPEDVGLYEINEAFSVVPMAVIKDLGVPREKVNVHGGAVALGHPIGASGARTLVTLLHAMRRHKAKIGIVSLCIGGGEAVAMAVELCE